MKHEAKRKILTNYEQQVIPESFGQEMLDNLLHEISVPLAFIQSASERIASYGNDMFVSKYVHIIKENIWRIYYLSQVYIDSYKIQEDQMPQVVHPVDVSAFFRDIVESWKEFLTNNKNITVEADIAPHVVWNTDEHAFIRIVVSTIFNAYRNMSYGSTVLLSLSVVDNVLHVSARFSGDDLDHFDKMADETASWPMRSVAPGSEEIMSDCCNMDAVLAFHLVKHLHGTLRLEHQEDNLCLIEIALPNMLVKNKSRLVTPGSHGRVIDKLLNMDENMINDLMSRHDETAIGHQDVDAVPMSQPRGDDGAPCDPDDRQFIKMVQYTLSSNLSNPDFSPENLAEAMALGTRNLYRRFRELNLPTPNDFIKGFKIEAAANMLKNTGISIADVMLRCGFHTRSQFYHEFRKRFNMTPREFRAQ